MADLEEIAFQIARYMRDHRRIGAHIVLGSTLRNALGLSLEDFDVADDFLREAHYCDGVSAGDSAQLVLSEAGVRFVSRKLQSRLKLTRDAEQLLSYLATWYRPDIGFVAYYQSKSALLWTEDRYRDAAQIVTDEGLATETRIQEARPFAELTITSKGRNAVRNNFSSSTPIMNLELGDNISITNFGDGSVIAAGREATAIQSLGNAPVDRLFTELEVQLEKQQGIADSKVSEAREVGGDR